MPWTPNDAERRTHKATGKSPTKAWNEPATKAALSGSERCGRAASGTRLLAERESNS